MTLRSPPRLFVLPNAPFTRPAPAGTSSRRAPPPATVSTRALTGSPTRLASRPSKLFSEVCGTAGGRGRGSYSRCVPQVSVSVGRGSRKRAYAHLWYINVCFEGYQITPLSSFTCVRPQTRRHGSRTTPHARRAAGGRAPGRPARERGARRPERDGPAAGLQLHAERSRGPRPRSAVPGARRAPPATTADRGAARAGRVRDRVHPGPGAARSARSLVIPFATRGARRNG